MDTDKIRTAIESVGALVELAELYLEVAGKMPKKNKGYARTEDIIDRCALAYTKMLSDIEEAEKIRIIKARNS